MAQINYWVNGDGVTQAWTLPAMPSGPVEVYLNGGLQSPNNYTVVGQLVTLSFIPQGGSEPDEVAFVFFSTAAPAPPAPPSGAGTASLVQVSEVVNDPDMAQPFTILRSTGTAWLNGVWQSSTTEFSGYGVIADPTDREIKMIPEGDQVVGAKVFWSAQPIYATRATSGVGASSDILVWRGLSFRVVNVQQFQDYGFYRAIATRMKAD